MANLPGRQFHANNLNGVNMSAIERIGGCFDELRNEVEGILNEDIARQEYVQKLQNDLQLYKYANTHLESESRVLREKFAALEKERDDLLAQSKGNRIVTLIDGDGTIFRSTLIEAGRQGGHHAALTLTDSITQYLHANVGANQYQIWVYVFFNKGGLYSILPFDVRNKLEDFIVGFNQASERFMMVDVGAGKEAADAKVKGLLETEIRLPQTEKIVFGGSHDNGYVTTLRSQMTSGLKSKLIILQGYAEIASGIEELNSQPLKSLSFLSQRRSSTLSCINAQRAGHSSRTTCPRANARGRMRPTQSVRNLKQLAPFTSP